MSVVRAVATFIKDGAAAILAGEDGSQVTITPGGGSLPPGGTTGQVLTKESDASGDAGWENGGSQPVNWCMVTLIQATPTPLTAGSPFYAFEQADLAITLQSGSDFSIGEDTGGGGLGGAVISTAGGRFQAAILLQVPTDASLDGGSDVQRWLKAGVNIGTGEFGPVGPGQFGLDTFVPVTVGGSDSPACCSSSAIGYADPGGVAVTGVFADLSNAFGTDSVPVNHAFRGGMAVWQV